MKKVFIVFAVVLCAVLALAMTVSADADIRYTGENKANYTSLYYVGAENNLIHHPDEFRYTTFQTMNGITFYGVGSRTRYLSTTITLGNLIRDYDETHYYYVYTRGSTSINIGYYDGNVEHYVGITSSGRTSRQLGDADDYIGFMCSAGGTVNLYDIIIIDCGTTQMTWVDNPIYDATNTPRPTDYYTGATVVYSTTEVINLQSGMFAYVSVEYKYTVNGVTTAWTAFNNPTLIYGGIDFKSLAEYINDHTTSAPSNIQVRINFDDYYFSTKNASVWGYGITSNQMYFTNIYGVNADLVATQMEGYAIGYYSFDTASSYTGTNLMSRIVLLASSSSALSEMQLFTVNASYSDGYSRGYDEGSAVSYSSGYAAGNDAGYRSGYNVGLADGATGQQFQHLFYAVIDVPVTAFKSLLNFDLLGINMLYFVTSLLTLAVIFLILKKVLK